MPSAPGFTGGSVFMVISPEGGKANLESRASCRVMATTSPILTNADGKRQMLEIYEGAFQNNWRGMG